MHTTQSEFSMKLQEHVSINDNDELETFHEGADNQDK